MDFYLKIDRDPTHPAVVVVPRDKKGFVGVALITVYPKNRQESQPFRNFYPKGKNAGPDNFVGQVELRVEFIKFTGLDKFVMGGTPFRPMTVPELTKSQKAMGEQFTSRSTFCFSFVTNL